MSHDHTNVRGRLVIAIWATFAFVIVEALVGSYSHSLALLSDAGHNLADVLALVLSWYGTRVATRPPNQRLTFGYHRVSILMALVNATSLLVIAAFIDWEAVDRLRHPQPVESHSMIIVAFLAVVLNSAISYGLHAEAQHDINIKSAYIHMLGDALSAGGVVIAGFVVAATGSVAVDPIASILISIMIVWSGWGILKETVEILLESSPAGLDMVLLEKTITNIPGVRTSHDLHVWTIGSGLIACSCHIVVNEQTVRSGQNVLREVAHVLSSQFGVTHTTIQIEVEGCEPDDMYCVMRAGQHPDSHA